MFGFDSRLFFYILIQYLSEELIDYYENILIKYNELNIYDFQRKQFNKWEDLQNSNKILNYCYFYSWNTRFKNLHFRPKY